MSVNEIVTIIGRKDDMIISGGENVHPVQVEEVLAGHPDVADSIVVGLPDEQWGEVVVAYIQPREGRMLDHAQAAKSLEDFTRESVSLAGYKRPRAYRLVDSLPMTATGKKMHFRVRETAIGAVKPGLRFAITFRFIDPPRTSGTFGSTTSME